MGFLILCLDYTGYELIFSSHDNSNITVLKNKNITVKIF